MTIEETMKKIESLPDGKGRILEFRDLGYTESEYVDICSTDDLKALVAEIKALRERVGLLEDVLRFSNIEVFDDGSHQFAPKAVKHYCGVEVAERLARVTAERDALIANKTCEWTEGKDYVPAWNTECEYQMPLYTVGRDVVYCPQCGGKVVVNPEAGNPVSDNHLTDPPTNTTDEPKDCSTCRHKTFLGHCDRNLVFHNGEMECIYGDYQDWEARR